MEKNFTVTGSAFLVPLFAGSFLFVAENVRQMFRVCSIQYLIPEPLYRLPKAVSSNRTA